MEQPTAEVAASAQVAVQNPAPAAAPASNQIAPAPTPTSSAQLMTPSKPIHSLVIDANAIINNDPTVSTLLAQAEELYTIPAVVSESVSTPARVSFVGLEAWLTVFFSSR